ncbi:AAA family ATPase [Hydrogenophaga sp.]|uniref:AAA family ATPase n=1 Tax=Hydrogenophaga sp. TaxID=1904254 RepID=UPI002623B694|nr:AAA family ATPase [Hydrogenophaga sp.]MDM7948283.1 AAA family ATPase [Hydrogenophaga sp.]
MAKKEADDGSDRGGMSAQGVLFNRLCASIDRSLAGKRGPSFTYLIGNNGTGKSRQLARLAEHFGESEASHAPKVVGCISNAVYDRFKLRLHARIQYLGARTSGNAVFHSAISRQLAKIILKGMARDKKSVDRLEEALELRFEFSFGKVGGDLAKLIDRRKLKNAKISSVLPVESRKTLATLMGQPLSFTKLTRQKIAVLAEFLDLNPDVQLSVVKNASEQRIDFNQLSTGEQNRVLTYAKVLSVAGESSLILIDEPEISLHLHWQMGFHSAIVDLLRNFKRFHVVVATHSPIIISEGAKGPDASKAAVVVLEANDDLGASSDVDIREHPFSEISSHERLVLDLFDTATYRTPAVDFEITDAILEAVDHPQLLEQVLKRLEALEGKEGLTRDDLTHIREAIRLIQNQSLTSANSVRVE